MHVRFLYIDVLPKFTTFENRLGFAVNYFIYAYTKYYYKNKEYIKVSNKYRKPKIYKDEIKLAFKMRTALKKYIVKYNEFKKLKFIRR